MWHIFRLKMNHCSLKATMNVNQTGIQCRNKFFIHHFYLTFRIVVPSHLIEKFRYSSIFRSVFVFARRKMYFITPIWSGCIFCFFLFFNTYTLRSILRIIQWVSRYFNWTIYKHLSIVYKDIEWVFLVFSGCSCIKSCWI